MSPEFTATVKVTARVAAPAAEVTEALQRVIDAGLWSVRSPEWIVSEAVVESVTPAG